MQVIIDYRINDIIEKYFKSLGYDVIKVKKNSNVYNEISSHTDIFCFRLENNLFCIEDCLDSSISKKYIVKYSNNINEYTKYNICLVDNFAIHNFQKTDKDVLNHLKKLNYTLINVKQAYSRCSILPLKNKCCITCDKGVYKVLKENDFDVLLIEENLDIKLHNGDKTYSDMKGFIGGCSCVIDDTVIFFGDLRKFKCKEKIVNYLENRGYKIKDFKNMEMIDYGSCIILN